MDRTLTITFTEERGKYVMRTEPYRHDIPPFESDDFGEAVDVVTRCLEQQGVHRDVDAIEVRRGPGGPADSRPDQIEDIRKTLEKYARDKQMDTKDMDNGIWLVRDSTG